MLKYAETANRFVTGVSFEAFLAGEMRMHAVAHCLELVGDAARHVPPSERDRLSRIAWADIIGMRNRLAHGYVTVNLKIVWTTAVMDTPGLIEELRAALRDMEGRSDGD